MFEILAEALKALGPWPVVQFAGALLLIYVGIVAVRRGEKDKKPTNGEATPRWFVTEQTLEVLREIKGELRLQSQYLEQIANENMINPRK